MCDTTEQPFHPHLAIPLHSWSYISDRGRLSGAAPPSQSHGLGETTDIPPYTTSIATRFRYPLGLSGGNRLAIFQLDRRPESALVPIEYILPYTRPGSTVKKRGVSLGKTGRNGTLFPL